MTDTLLALIRILARIESQHRCKTVFRVHADRAQEVTGDRIGAALAERGIRVSSTAGVEPNANGRAERGVRWLKEKARTYLSARINPKGPMVERRLLWPFAIQHAAEVQRRGCYGETALRW